MPFFQPAFYAPSAADQAFVDLFSNLIGDGEAFQPRTKQQKTSKGQSTTAVAAPQTSGGGPLSRSGVFGSLRTFNPRFDVRETDGTYELHGELAGVDRNNVSLEFTEPQTLVISGRVERNYSAGSPPASPAESTTPDAVADTHSDAGSEAGDGARTPNEDEGGFTDVRAPSPAASHHAMVTDEATEAALEKGVVTTTTPAQAPAKAQQPQQAQAQQKKPADGHYWIKERSVGSFKRVFSFPVPVDEANVRASLDNGILTVSIPKVKRESRRIAIQ